MAEFRSATSILHITPPALFPIGSPLNLTSKTTPYGFTLKIVTFHNGIQ